MDDEAAAAEELLKKLQALEEGQAYLKEELVEFRDYSYSYAEPENQRAHARLSSKRRSVGGRGGASWQPLSLNSYADHEPENQKAHSEFSSKRRIGDGRGGASWQPSSLNFSDRQYLNILQSIGPSLHILDPHGRIIYW